MSLLRLIFWSGMLGGWSAFFGWLLAELMFGRWANTSYFGSICLAMLVAALIGAGLSLVGGLANLSWAELTKRIVPGLLGGLVGGFIGAGAGSGLYALLSQPSGFVAFLARMLGWVVMGTCLGIVEGVYERSKSKIAKGALGGALGGLVGGACFNPISTFVGSPMTSRAFAFVVLGLMIGLFVGLVQVVLKEAWLTVEKGFRPGRQILLGDQTASLGTSEKATLIFIAYGAKGVEPIHATIERMPDNSYTVRDQNSRTGTFVNGVLAKQSTALKNDDLIQFGANEVRFRESAKHAAKKPEIPTAILLHEPPLPASAPPISHQPRPLKAPAAVEPKVTITLPPVDKKKPGPCPTCGCLVKGPAGKRRCPNCFGVF